MLSTKNEKREQASLLPLETMENHCKTFGSNWLVVFSDNSLNLSLQFLYKKKEKLLKIQWKCLFFNWVHLKKYFFEWKWSVRCNKWIKHSLVQAMHLNRMYRISFFILTNSFLFPSINNILEKMLFPATELIGIKPKIKINSISKLN